MNNADKSTQSLSMQKYIISNSSENYGIIGINNGKTIIRVDNVTPSLDRIRYIVDTLNNFNVSFYHFDDILEQLLE